MVEGLTGKTQKRLGNIYKRYDKTFSGVEELKKRFRHVMDVIDELIGNQIRDTVYTSRVYFFTLFVFLYDNIYGLGSSLGGRKARRIQPGLKDCLLKVSDDFRSENVPAEVLDAVQRASSDFGRRTTRLQYLQSVCNA